MEILNFIEDEIGAVLPKTKADSDLQLMFECLALYFANAMLYAELYKI